MKGYLRQTATERLRHEGIRYTVRKGLDYLLRHRGRRVQLGIVSIETTTACNLKCPGCPMAAYSSEGASEVRHIAPGDFLRIVRSIPFTHILSPHTAGEPSLHPDLPELLRLAREHGKFNVLAIHSNGVARDPEYYIGLLDKELDKLCISVDTLDPGLIDHLRTGTPVDKLKQCISALYKRFPEEISVRTVVSAANIHTIPDLLAELNDLGELDVVLAPHHDLRNESKGLSDADREALMRRMPALKKRFNNLRVSGPEMIRSSAVCSAPWYRPAINMNGDVVPCCMFAMPHKSQDTALGNALKQEFATIWNSPQAEAFRKDFEVRSPIQCEQCAYYAMRY